MGMAFLKMELYLGLCIISGFRQGGVRRTKPSLLVRQSAASFFIVKGTEAKLTVNKSSLKN